MNDSPRPRAIVKCLEIAGIAAIVAAFALLIGVMVTSGTSPVVRVADAEPSTSPTPTAPAGTDDRGFVDSAARCDGSSFGLAIGRTQGSLVAICSAESGEYEYRGVRVSDGATLVLPAQLTGAGSYLARNDSVTYTVSPKELVATSGDTVVKREVMIEYWEPRFAAEAGPSSEETLTTVTTPATPDAPQ